MKQIKTDPSVKKTRRKKIIYKVKRPILGKIPESKPKVKFKNLESQTSFHCIKNISKHFNRNDLQSKGLLHSLNTKLVSINNKTAIKVFLYKSKELFNKFELQNGVQIKRISIKRTKKVYRIKKLLPLKNLILKRKIIKHQKYAKQNPFFKRQIQTEDQQNLPYIHNGNSLKYSKLFTSQKHLKQRKLNKQNNCLTLNSLQKSLFNKNKSTNFISGKKQINFFKKKQIYNYQIKITNMDNIRKIVTTDISQNQSLKEQPNNENQQDELDSSQMTTYNSNYIKASNLIQLNLLKQYNNPENNLNTRSIDFTTNQQIPEEINPSTKNLTEIQFADQTQSELSSLINNSSANQYSKNEESVLTSETMEYTGKLKKQLYLGGGGEANVYLVKLEDLDEIVALKQYEYKNNNKDMQELYSKIKKEFRMLASLDHENIIKYFCMYKPAQRECKNSFDFGVIMEFLAGGSLEVYINNQSQKGITNLPQLKDYIRQILEGLNFLHKNKIIHRDLKPGNLLLTNDKKLIKIGDFGISKLTKNNSITKRSFVGTPWYMAPEVIEEKPYSYKADIWSLGCCFMHMVTGEKPFKGASPMQAFMQITTVESPLSKLSKENIKKIEQIPDFKDFLVKCFHKDPEQRLLCSELLNHKFLNN